MLSPNLDSDFVSDLIGKIYDCAFEPPQWPHVLTTIRAALGDGPARIVEREIRLLSNGGGCPNGASSGGDHAFGHADRSAVAQRHGLPHVAAACVGATRDAQVEMVAVPSEAGACERPITGAAAEVLDILIPHIHRLQRIARRLDRAAASRAALERTLDMLTVGIFLVDDRNRLVHANSAGVAMIEAGEPLELDNGRLLAKSPAIAVALADAIAGIGREDAGERCPSSPAIAMRSLGGAHHVAHVLDLSQGSRDGMPIEATVAIVVVPVRRGGPIPIGVLMSLFDLTPAEARVLAEIARGRTPADTAETLSVAKSTIKTHLVRIFAKTRTGRQADLAVLANAVTLPL